MAASLSAARVLLARAVVQNAARSFQSSQVQMIQTTLPALKAETMKQVDVDELEVQKRLGHTSMNFVRKAEKKNKARAKMHRFYRRTDWMIAAFCFALVISIYSYTMFAIKQETFLDDFDMPEEIDRTEPENK